MEFNSSYSHQNGTPFMHYIHERTFPYSNSKKKFEFFSLVLQRLSATSQGFSSGKKLSRCGLARACMHARGLQHNKDEEEKKEHFIIQTQKKILNFFHLPFVQRLSATLKTFPLEKTDLACGRVYVYGRAGYSIIKMKKKRKNISLFKLKKNF